MDLIPFALSLLAGSGAYLLWTDWNSTPGHRTQAGTRTSIKRYVWTTLAVFGFDESNRRNLSLLCTASGTFAAIACWTLLGGVLAPATAALLCVGIPVALQRHRTQTERSRAADAWPLIIDDIRLQCGSLGRPLPQALFAAGRHAPAVMTDAFRKAEREWLLSTDFTRAIRVLETQLADATADMICETLLMAHTVGGSDVDRRLSALSDDRRVDVQMRCDARAKQAGVRFARRFVLVVPLGMAFAGLSIGDGKAAFETTGGQLASATALALLAACWWWSGRLVRLPHERRVFGV